MIDSIIENDAIVDDIATDAETQPTTDLGAVQAELEQARQALAFSQQIRSELAREKSDLEVRLAAQAYAAEEAERGLVEFKKRVVEVAMDQAVERDWCHEIEQILSDDLGLEVTPEKRNVRITVTIDAEVSCDRPLFGSYDTDDVFSVYRVDDEHFAITTASKFTVVNANIDEVEYSDWARLEDNN